ncbi:acriflavin resistance protein [Shewanella denitrificans OS217]|uniref:Acriflavin resistance protein n=1 Tax=Shewanella denitrificans (strain OS217 / ATCC BAA-1090 / DSM 15013) TaxID=318161 RepID=Q12PC8_SHEDO|nr:efflux RND transporter permease subunit [Shewanella denitrificans]ABE54698.1 acriflavin resistance protein [Shewanella denitrificans OS217]
MQPNSSLGISGRLANAFQHNAITPLLAALGLLMGLFAIIVTPKEEEPQIDVTFADVFIPYPGATPVQVEQQVTRIAEQLISEIKGIDTLYSFSQQDGALIIVIFEVGVPRDEAIINLYNQFYANKDKFNSAAGIGEPLIKPRGIEDVPVMSLTLWSAPDANQPSTSAAELTLVASRLETELQRIPGTREIYTQGRQDAELNIRIDPMKMNSFGVGLDDLLGLLANTNQLISPGNISQNNQVIKIQSNDFIQSVSDLEQLIIKVLPTKDSQVPQGIYLADIADISLGKDNPKANVWHHTKQGSYPAVTIAIGKQVGHNAVVLTEAINARLASLKNQLIPANINVTVSRDYGKTAGDKANTLILKLLFATAAVILLVLITMGVKEALVVGIAIIITLGITLFASWAWGFTLNRISLFALIFSIGILVDDAIVVVENIHRHRAISDAPLTTLIPKAVDEVGGPTILATFTVIAALLPMAFVSGLMGPYMSPIPINASMGMLISLLVAFIITPWLSAKFLSASHSSKTSSKDQNKPTSGSRLNRLFTRLMGPFIFGKSASKNRKALTLGVVALISVAIALPMMQAVVLKMLPFDNKSEFQVMVDMPEGTPVAMTHRVLAELSQYLIEQDEVLNVQGYAGTHAPMNFNGLVRHYYLRNSQELGDIQVNLLDKSQRERNSHDIALSVREPLQQIASRYHANVKIVEVPPGPPVWAPLVAEVYGPTAVQREHAAQALLSRFNNTSGVVDADIFLPAPQQQWQITIDKNKASLLGVPYQSILTAIKAAVDGINIGYLHQTDSKLMPSIRLQFDDRSKQDLQQLLALRLASLHTSDGQNTTTVPMSELISIEKSTIDTNIVRKNMQPMIMVTADMAGETGSPLYGMFDMVSQINNQQNEAPEQALKQHFISEPDGLLHSSILWDGEWKITYETFRDMGLAYAIGMIAIYLLVVAHVKSYKVPLIIMAPIPLTIIGVMPGHALLGAQFSAPSMIGMIALAGIIVRNSILLVDFIQQQVAQGESLANAVINASAVRSKPILLTALAAMSGALFIIDDPIFNGLAISLIFGILISSLLTLVLIPVMYFAFMANPNEQD